MPLLHNPDRESAHTWGASEGYEESLRSAQEQDPSGGEGQDPLTDTHEGSAATQSCSVSETLDNLTKECDRLEKERSDLQNKNSNYRQATRVLGEIFAGLVTSGEPGERSERLSEAFGVPHEDDGAWIHNKAERSRVTHNAAEYLCGTGSRPSLDRELGGENPPECSKMREALVEGFSLHLDNCPQTTAAPTAGSANIGQSYGQISKNQ